MDNNKAFTALTYLICSPAFESKAKRHRIVSTNTNAMPDKWDHLNDVCRLKHCRDFYEPGDQFTIEGPILGYDDAMLYSAIIEEARKQKRTDGRVCVKANRFLSSMGKKKVDRMHRKPYDMRLERLAKAFINYTSAKGRSWTGVLICEHGIDNTVPGGIYYIRLNMHMSGIIERFNPRDVPPYLLRSRIRFDSKRMQLYLRLKSKNLPETVGDWMNILGSENKGPRNYISKLTNEQITAGLLTEDSHLVEGSDLLSLTAL
jgi:hypothetical protein